jgi:hypothetical protein
MGGAMTETFEQQPRVRRPVCPYCKLPMRYQLSEVESNMTVFDMSCSFAAVV